MIGEAGADDGRGRVAETPDETRTAFELTWKAPTSFAGWFATVNNNPLGARYMVTSLMFFLIAGVMGLFIRTQLIVPENTFLDPETYNQLFTMHGSTMMYLFVVPFLDLDPTYKDAWGQPLLRVTYDFHDNDYNLYRYLAARCAELMRAMNPSRIYLTEELEPYNVHSYQSTHCTGGAIMGSDPGNSVTNKYGQLWDTPNVFVTGAALYPQNPGMNPTGPLLALSYFTGEALSERYFRNPRELLDS